VAKRSYEPAKEQYGQSRVDPIMGIGNSSADTSCFVHATRLHIIENARANEDVSIDQLTDLTFVGRKNT